MRRTLLGLSVLAALCSVTGCSTEGPIERPAGREVVNTANDEIIAGTVDTVNQAAVAVFLFQGDQFGGACSGTIIAKTGSTGYVLTAGHCKSDSYLIVQADDWEDCIDGSGQIDPGLAGCGEVYEVNDEKRHPEYSDDYFGDGSDVPAPDFMLLRFSGANADTPVIPADDGSANLSSGDQVEFSGYGLMNQGGELVQTSQRRRATNDINDIFTDPPLFDFEQSFGGPGGTCQGDSGGPALHGGYVVGVTSFGEEGCVGQSYSAHVQQVYADFIAPYIGAPLPDPTCGECVNTSVSPGGECSAAFDACVASSTCTAILECGNTCETQSCFDDCVADNQSGVEGYNAVITCAYCTGCDSICNEDFCDDPSSTSAGPGPSATSADASTGVGQGVGTGVAAGTGAGSPTSVGAGDAIGSGGANGNGDGGANGDGDDDDGDGDGGKDGGNGSASDDDDGCAVNAAGAPARSGVWALGLAGVALAAASRRRRA